VLHPAMTFVAVHSSRTIACLNGLYFVEKVPMRAFLRLVVIQGRFSSVVLDIVSIGAISPVVALYHKKYSSV